MTDEICPVTTPVNDGPTRDFALGGDWYRSEDELLWLAKGGPWRAGGNKVPWIRPAGTQLQVTGTRLDSPAPLLSAQIPDGYLDDLQITGLIFPTDGCWQIEAQAGDSVLQVVVEVFPAHFFANEHLPLLVTVDPAQKKLYARSIDSFTLMDVTGFPTLSLGHHYLYAFDPTDNILAYIQWPHGSSNDVNGTLHWFDFEQWTMHDTGIMLGNHVSWLGFGSGDVDHSTVAQKVNKVQNDSALYWLVPTETDPLHGLPRVYTLYRYAWDPEPASDARISKPTAIAKLPHFFVPWEERVLGQGRHLAIFGVPTNAQNFADGAPRLFLINLPDGEIISETVFPNLTAGQVPPAEQSDVYHRYVAGLAWDVERERLYLIDPISEQVTTVNLSNGQVLDSVALHMPATIRWHWLVPVAQAKGNAEIRLHAQVSANGKQLYLGGWQREMVQDEAGDWQWPQHSLGLREIELDTFTVNHKIELPIREIHLSPNGEYLFLPKFEEPKDNMAPLMGSGGLSIVETASFQQTAYLESGRYITVHGFSTDGRYAYLSYEVETEKYQWERTPLVVDLEAVSIVAERTVSGGFLDLLLP